VAILDPMRDLPPGSRQGSVKGIDCRSGDEPHLIAVPTSGQSSPCRQASVIRPAPISPGFHSWSRDGTESASRPGKPGGHAGRHQRDPRFLPREGRQRRAALPRREVFFGPACFPDSGRLFDVPIACVPACSHQPFTPTGACWAPSGSNDHGDLPESHRRPRARGVRGEVVREPCLPFTRPPIPV
jgi:hypothetical protein